MLDERESALLKTINGLCGEGGFKIAEAGDLLAAFPPSWGVERAQLDRLVRALESRRYIDVKYAEDGVYCLCPLPEGRRYFEEASAARREGELGRRENFFMAALGGFLGGLIGALLALIPLLMRA